MLNGYLIEDIKTTLGRSGLGGSFPKPKFKKVRNFTPEDLQNTEYYIDSFLTGMMNPGKKEIKELKKELKIPTGLFVVRNFPEYEGDILTMVESSICPGVPLFMVFYKKKIVDFFS